MIKKHFKTHLISNEWILMTLVWELDSEFSRIIHLVTETMLFNYHYDYQHGGYKPDYIY